MLGVLSSGCNDGGDRHDGMLPPQTMKPVLPPPPPPSAILLALSPDNSPKVQQGASLQFAVSVTTNGVTSNADSSELSFTLSNPSVGTIGGNSGLFTASLTEVGKSDIQVVFTRGADTATEVFTNAVEVVNQVTTPSPPKRTILQPTQVRLMNGESLTFTLSVEREDGTTVSVDPASNEYVATLSNAQVDVLTLLDFVADANNTGFTDISVDVTMAGQTLTTNFPNAIEVVAAPPPPPPPLGEHFNILDPTTVSHMTSEVDASGANTGRQGLVAWHKVTSVSGNNVTVKITVYFGPFGSDDNTLGPTMQPRLWRGYQDGAQTGRDASHYTPLEFTEVAGTSRFLWEVVIPTFPTTGTFSYGITLDGDDVTHSNGTNVYMGGFPWDSSYNSTRTNLEATYDSGSGEVVTTPAP